MTENYTDVCVLRRCGELEGPEECCLQIQQSGLKKIVLDYLWSAMPCARCACNTGERCLLLWHRTPVAPGTAYCYPHLSSKRPTRVVIVMFALYCADRAAARAAAAARVAAYAAAARADAADAARAAAAAWADAAHAAAAARAAARDRFYRDASAEIARLVQAYGKEDREQ